MESLYALIESFWKPGYGRSDTVGSKRWARRICTVAVWAVGMTAILLVAVAATS